MGGRNEVTIDLGHLAGFVTLAATLPSFHAIPTAGLILLLGVDRFMKLIGNGVETIAIAKWEGAFDRAAVDAVIAEQAGRFPTGSLLSLTKPSTSQTSKCSETGEQNAYLRRLRSY